MDETEHAAKALDEFVKGPAMEAADEVARAFEIAGDRIAKSLEQAAIRGEFSFSGLAESVSRDLARLAINELVAAPLEAAFGNLGSKLLGGSSQSAKPPVIVNMTVNGGGASADIKQSEGQIAARLAQAVARGQGRA